MGAVWCCSCSCRCVNDCCAEVVPVTINETSVSIAGLTITAAVSSVAVDEALVTIDLGVEDQFPLRLWFVDNPATPAQRSAIPPTSPGVVDWNDVSDSDGTKEVTVQHPTLRTWYLVVQCGAALFVSDAITVGA